MKMNLGLSKTTPVHRNYGQGGYPLTPNELELMGRSSFGGVLATSTTVFGNFDYTDAIMQNYYGAPGWLRATADQGDVAAGDPATVERCEMDTLGILEPTVGTHPEINLGYELFIPNSHYIPGGSCAIVVGQVILTTYGPPVQIIYHTAGNLRLRSLISGTFQHTIIAAAGTFRGRWVRIDIDGIWSKTSAARTRVRVDGVEKYSLTGVQNVGDTADDANKVYCKIGAYRTACDTDPSRGLASIWYRNVTATQIV